MIHHFGEWIGQRVGGCPGQVCSKLPADVLSDCPSYDPSA